MEQFKDDPKEMKNKIMAERNGEKERVKHEYGRIAGGGAAAGGDSVWLYGRKAGMHTRALRLDAVEARPYTKKARSLMMNAIRIAAGRCCAAPLRSIWTHLARRFQKTGFFGARIVDKRLFFTVYFLPCIIVEKS
jgi:hypothetical protein